MGKLTQRALKKHCINIMSYLTVLSPMTVVVSQSLDFKLKPFENPLPLCRLSTMKAGASP